MAVSGIVSYDPATATFTLPAEHAACLTGVGFRNLARFSQLGTHIGTHVGAVAECFRAGGGVPYEAFRPEFTGVMDAANRNTLDEHLVADFLPLVPGLTRRLREGGRVADAGCGTGHALVVLAREFPASTFTGYDLAVDAIERARKEATDAGLTNVRFEQQDVAALGPSCRPTAIGRRTHRHDIEILESVKHHLSPGPAISSRPAAAGTVDARPPQTAADVLVMDDPSEISPLLPRQPPHVHSSQANGGRNHAATLASQHAAVVLESHRTLKP